MTTILQVEDDPNDVFFFKKALNKAGVTNPIQVATDGQQAIDYLKGAGDFADREKFPLPCLMVLDLKLPHVMGLDVLKWIREQHGRALVVIIMSASAEEMDIAAAYRLGANAFLTKPSQANKLDDIAKAIKDFWLTHNTMPQESHAEPTVSGRMHAPGTAFVAKRPSAVNGPSRREWPTNLQINK